MSPLATALDESARHKSSAPVHLEDEPFWRRFSSRHELEISTALSLAIHAAVVGVLLAGGVIAVRMGLGEGHGPLDVAALDLSEPGAAEPKLNPGSNQPHGPEIHPQPPAISLPSIKPTNTQLAPPPAPTQISEPRQDDQSGRIISDSDKAGRDFKAASDAFRAVVRDVGGPGGGNGRPAGNMASETIKRAIRWNLIFRPAGIEEHVRQLAALRAVLAFPQSDGRYLVVRNLKPLAHGRVEDIRRMDRIFWVDQEKNVAADIARYLGLGIAPTYFVAFLPKELEERMQRMEETYRGKSERDIRLDEKFNFEVVPRGQGYDVIAAAVQH
jgi:hypothetical protein